MPRKLATTRIKQEETSNQRIEGWAKSYFCPECGGFGQVIRRNEKFTKICPACSGTGKRKIP